MPLRTITSIVFFCLSTLACFAQSNKFPTSGNAGIGTTAPQAPLHTVLSNGTASYPSTTSRGDVLHYFSANNNGLEIGLARGNNSRRAWILARHANLTDYGHYYATLHFQPQLDIITQYRGVAIGYPVSTTVSTGVGLAVKGNVGIGTTNPQAKLAVEGNILAKEVKVKTDITVPDYVFEPDYKLATLADVEAYVKEHKHLPEIPSAKDIAQHGLDLAAMNLLLLKKVEELTLHLIEKEKETKLMQLQLRQHEQRLNQIQENE